MLLDIFATCLSKKEEGPSYESSIPAQKEQCKKLRYHEINIKVLKIIQK